ncbi:MAG: hypothetical protein SV201_14620 [Pseudomonadota bacterium]|nr:hypothetical protein [Pseudomonadota bacterium]
MKLLTVLSGFLLMTLAVPLATAQQDGELEQRMEQFRDQGMQREMQHMEKRQKRIEMHQENKYRYQQKARNQLQEKQKGGFRLNSGSGKGR